MSRILIISSDIHKDLSSRQLDSCLQLVKKSGYDYQIEVLNAGTYEIPFVINTYAQKNLFDSYLALGLILVGDNYHYDYIISHIKNCFTHFALNNIIIGNGIIAGTTVDELADKIASSDPCLNGYGSAFDAVDCLMKVKKRV